MSGDIVERLRRRAAAALVGYATGTARPLADVLQADADKVKEAVASFAAGKLIVSYSDAGDVSFVAAGTPADVPGGEPY